MPKESDAFNKIDKNSAEMIVYPQNTEVEEVLISDEELNECDAESYESKLNEKLKDLGLYEDGMTIQQKEELLSVIVASWETAEKEKTRRQFFQEYMNASEAFCNDEIEFSFQEPPELSNDSSSLLPSVSSCLDVTLSVDTSHVSCYSGDCGTDSAKTSDEFAMQSSVNEIASDSSVEACGNESVCGKSNELESYSSREVKPKGRTSRRGRPRRGRGNAKQSVGMTCVVNPSTNEKKNKETGELTSRLSEKEALEKSMSLWKPCLSPKDTPLTSSKKPWLNGTNIPDTYSEEEYSKKILRFIKEFDFARKESQELWKSDLTLDKPYHLSRRVHFSKRSSKPDKYDIMVGVQEKKANDPTDAPVNAFTKSEPFSRTSGGAFRYVKSHRDRSHPTQSNYEAMTTRSGTRYGLNSSDATQKSDQATHKPDDLKDSEDLAFFKDEGSLPCLDSPSHLFNEVEVILDEKLPHFNHLKPGLSDDAVSFVSDTFVNANGLDKSPESSRTSSSKSNSHTISTGFQQLNHIDKSLSYVGSDSSDTSSVIDVETIGDDEVQEFILKRKMLQDFQSIEKQPGAKPRKRSRKGAS